MKCPLRHRLALVAALAAGACDGSGAPPAPDLGPPVVHEEVAADVIEMFAKGSKAVTVLAQDGKSPLTATPFTPTRTDLLASDAVHHVLQARAESAFEVQLPVLPEGSRLVARTFVYSVFKDGEAWRDPEPVTFRVLVNGKERASLSSDYITRPEGRKNPYDVLMRSLEIELPLESVLAVKLRFETTRNGRVVPPDAEQAEPLWWDLQVLQPVAVPRQAASREAPNILLLVVDTLGARRTSIQGAALQAAGRDTTPHLRELAERGLSFTRALSASSWTMPSVASLFTGLPPNTHGVLGNERSYLMSGLRTVAEALRERGLETAAFSANVLLAPITGFDQGFGHYELAAIGEKAGESKEPAAAMNARLLRWLDAQPRGARWFAWVQYMDPHAPYDAPGAGRTRYCPGHVERRDFAQFMPGQVQFPAAGFVPLAEDEKAHLADLHDAEVAYFDEQLGHLIEALRERGLQENTLVVLTADHGEELFEHGLIGHGYTLHDELLHVPLVFAGPGFRAGGRRDEPVGTAGVAAALLAAGGAKASDIVPSVLLPPDAAAGPVFSTVRTDLFGPRQVQVAAEDAAGRKVIVVDDPQGVRVKVLRFDRRADPAEQQPLDPSALPAEVRAAFDALQQAAIDWATRTAAASPPGPQPWSPGIDDAMRKIGYVGGAESKPKKP